jgi:hypothetical protein
MMPLAKRSDNEGAEIVAGDALGFLRAVYLNPSLPLPLRMRAAETALPFEKPKLAVTAIVDGGDFAKRLDAAIARSGLAPKVIEASPETSVEPVLPPSGPSPTPLGAPFASFRRRG